MPHTYGFNRSLGGAIAAIAAVSLLCSAVTLATLKELDAATEARGQANRVIERLNQFRDGMLNQETGLRGYLLTGNDSSLAPYREGRPLFERSLADLHGLLAGDPTQATLLAEAETAARAWQANVGEAAIREATRSATLDEARRIESNGEGKKRFDEFRERLDAIEAVAQAVLKQQGAVVDRAEHRATLTLWAGAAMTLLICAAVAFAVNRLIARPLVRLADAMRRLSERDLTTDVPSLRQRDEVGEMARAVEVFKNSLIELDRTSLLRATADTLPAMVGYVDAQRRIGFLNGEFERWFDFHGNDVSENYGRPMAQVFPGNAFPGADRELEAAFGGKEMRFEHQLSPLGAAWRELEAFYRPHRAPDGRVLGVVTLLTDITERKRMELRLARQTTDLLRSNEELEQFAYVASHDLKAPLRGIENLVSWIEEDLDGALAGDTRTNMDLLKSRVRRLESLLDDLLAYSRAGRGEETIATVDTKALVAELAALVSPPEGFSIAGAPDLPTLETAKAPLTQVLQNLISNAIKHHDHPATGHVRVEAATLRYLTEFAVIDDGPGIPERFRERVFGMFQTLRPRDEVEGSGMGLAIVKKLVERQGGRIWLTDGREGRGLAVHFTWPVNAGRAVDGTDREFASGR